MDLKGMRGSILTPRGVGLVDDGVEGVVDLLAADGEFWGELDAVAEDGADGGFDVVWDDVVAALEEGVGFGGADEGDGTAGAGAEADAFHFARGADESDGVGDDFGDGLDAGAEFLGLHDLGGGAEGLDAAGGEAGAGAA